MAISAVSFTLLPGIEAIDDPYWYCDGSDANDPNSGNHAPSVADRQTHTFGGAGGVHVTQNAAMIGAGGVIAYSTDDATNGACTSTELATTDGDGEWESGVNGAVFSVTDATNCGGYGNGHHGSPRDAWAINVAVPTYLSWHTGMDGAFHEPGDPNNVLNPCIGNGVISDDPSTDFYDCTSGRGWSIGVGVVVPAVLRWGGTEVAACDSVDDTLIVILHTGVDFTGGPAVSGFGHSEHALPYALGGTAHAACTLVNGSTTYYRPQGSPSNSPEWHSQCVVYLGIDTTAPLVIHGLSVPIEGVAFLQ